MITTYKIHRKDKDLPGTFIIKTFDAQKHFLLRTVMKFGNHSKEEIATMRKARALDVSQDKRVQEKFDFIAAAKSTHHHVAEGYIAGKSGGGEKLKAIVAKNLATYKPEKMLLVTRASQEVLPLGDLGNIREVIGLARDCSPCMAYPDPSIKGGIYWYLMMIDSDHL